MTIQTHAPTGQDTLNRRELITKLVEITGTPSSYLGMPSCAYQVGGYRVERDGSITAENAADLEALRPALVSLGYADPEPESANVAPDTALSAPDARATEPGEIQEPAESLPLNVTRPLSDVSPTQIRNILNTLYSYQHLLNRAIGSEFLSIHDDVVKHMQNDLPDTLDEMIRRLSDFKAQGWMDGVSINPDSITICYPKIATDTSDASVFTTLTVHLIDFAMKANRVTAKRKEPENEKFAMRGWLLRLGFNGAGYASVRRRLLRDLKGNSAFPTDEQAQQHRERYAAMRREQRHGMQEEAGE